MTIKNQRIIAQPSQRSFDYQYTRKYPTDFPQYAENLRIESDEKKTIVMPLHPVGQQNNIIGYPKKVVLFNPCYNDNYLNMLSVYDYNSKYFYVEIVREKDGKFSTLVRAPYLLRTGTSGNTTFKGFGEFFYYDSSAKEAFGLEIGPSRSFSFGGHAFIPIVNEAFSGMTTYASIDNFRYNEQNVSFDIEYRGSSHTFTNMDVRGLIY